MAGQWPRRAGIVHRGWPGATGRRNHFSFSDRMPLKSQFLIGLLCLARFAPPGGRRALALTADDGHRFCGIRLEWASASLLTNLCKQYPGAVIERR